MDTRKSDDEEKSISLNLKKEPTSILIDFK